MKHTCFLLTVVILFAACCDEVAGDGIVWNGSDEMNSKHESATTKRHLKGVKMADKVEERRLASISTLLEKIPTLSKFKELRPDLSKVSTLVVKGPKTKAAITILKKQLKALAVIGAIAVTGGFILYLVKK